MDATRPNDELVSYDFIEPDSFLAGTTQKKLLHNINFLNLVKRCVNCASMDEIEAEVKLKGSRYKPILTLKHQVSEQLCGILFYRKSKNEFVLAFIGAKKLEELVSCALGASFPTEAVASMNSVFSFLRGFTPPELHSTLPSFSAPSAISYDHQMGIYCHQGICKTGKYFLEPIMEAINAYTNPEEPIKLELVGHSFGGALAFQTAFYLRNNLIQRYFPDQDESWLQLGLVAFGSANFFDRNDLAQAESVIGAYNCLVIQRPRDPALQYTRMMGFENPGCHIFIDLATRGNDHDLDTYAAAIRSWTDPALHKYEEIITSSGK